MKSLGLATYFLGLEVHQLERGVFVHQRKYINDFVEMANSFGNNIMETPMELNVKYKEMMWCAW